MNRAGNERTGNRMLNIPVKGGAELTEATMAAINSDGYAVEATASAGLLIAGCVQRYCDNRNGADGEQTVSVKRGTFVWENDGTIKETDILKKCYIKDDLLVVPPALEETARLILEADQIDGTTNVLKGTAKLHVEPALAEHPEYWFLLCTNRFLKPFIYQLRKKIKFTSLTRDTDENVFMLDEYLYGADGRSNAGYGFWQMAYGSTGEVEAQAQG